MGDWKSKLPNLKEVGGFTSKLLTDVKNSVVQIVDEYKKNRAAEEAAAAAAAEAAANKPAETPQPKAEEKPTEAEPPKKEE